jgi:2-amino-4-hydroxy-6-hydroxymethyldihydropteridine diphosphokinase
MCAAPSTRAYVGLGSNLDNPREQVLKALAALGELPGTRLVARSRFYRSAPLGPADQPAYFNAVAALDTGLSALDLLYALQGIEQRQGRVRGALRWGPRTLDLDLLLYGESCISTPQLTVPHPGLHERAFVLYPLYELAPALWIPGRGALGDLIRRCSPAGLEPL